MEVGFLLTCLFARSFHDDEENSVDIMCWMGQKEDEWTEEKDAEQGFGKKERLRARQSI